MLTLEEVHAAQGGAGDAEGGDVAAASVETPSLDRFAWGRHIRRPVEPCQVLVTNQFSSQVSLLQRLLMRLETEASRQEINTGGQAHTVPTAKTRSNRFLVLLIIGGNHRLLRLIAELLGERGCSSAPMADLVAKLIMENSVCKK
jgi:hypothetical protein